MDKIKILCVGDVVGDIGIESIEKGLKDIQNKENIFFTIVNVENAADGMGLDRKSFNRLKENDIDCMTLGNHTWSKMEVFKIIGDKRIVRPANYPKELPGRGFRVYNKNGINIAVVNMLGAVNVGINVEGPLPVMERALENIKNMADIVVLDMHAEATAEKLTMFRYFENKIDIIYGTHTHVQTSDECIENNTAYITDVGMTGTDSGVLGMKKEVAIKRAKQLLPERYMQEKRGDGYIRGIVVTLEKENDRYIPKEIKRINKKVIQKKEA